MVQNQSVKILEISSYPPPHAGWGVRIQFVKRRLEQLGHICQVLNIGKSRAEKSTEYVDVQSGLDYCKKIDRFCKEGYLVHMHMNGQSPKGLVLSFLAEIISILNGRSCVLTFHAGADQRFFPKEKGRLISIVLYLLFKIPKYIICNDVIVKERIIDYGIDPTKVRTIQAFSKQYLDYKPVVLSDDLVSFIKERHPILSSYLLIRPTFDLPTLFHALKEVKQKWPDFGLVVMGSNTTSDDLDPEEVARLVQELDLESSLFWVGDLKHDHFLTILSKTSLFIRTYIYDGVCSSVLEARAFNIPVVACENPHRPPGISIFKTGDVEDLTQKILQVLSSKVPPRGKSTEVPDTVDEEAQLLLELAL